MSKYKFLEHTADIKYQAFGKTLEECFKNSVYALKEIITKEAIKPVKKKTIKIKGKDKESLLYNFLEEFLFLLDSENFIISKVGMMKIDLKKFRIKAIIYGDDIKKYNTITDIKAITYHDMFINKENDKYTCQVVLDV